MKPPTNPPGFVFNKYFMTYFCTNCKRTMQELIEKGKPAPKQLKTPCPNCECVTLVKV